LARGWAFAAVVAATMLVAACSAVAPKPLPTPSPSPFHYAVATPYPHLTDPATADSLYLALLAEALAVAPVNASVGAPGRDPVKRINATYAGWPLAISQFRSAKTLQAATRWRAGAKPGVREAPIEFIGQNILVQWGPITKASPAKPDATQLAAARALRDALDRLLSPLSARTIVPIPTPTPLPTADPSASSSPGPSATPGPSTRASVKP